ncbi:DUF418 domain-containing protein [Nocardiopsis sp. CNT-189]|uniref:DUF418 domain-containing protein n=1 Tax=Nocardiopsis oceanisediminis TaxID=2816862 RepID=UPI003B2AD3F0
MAGERRRIETLDVLRGFALCGILLVNIGPITHMGYEAIEAGRISGPEAPELWLHMLVAGRFFPIFSFLFGIGFAIFLDSAADRHPRPRLLLLRRLVALGLLGALHQTVHPGEALLPYAVFGLLVLVPASFLPRWAVLAGGAAGAVAGVTLVSGGMMLIPGMFLLGMAAARYRVPQRLDRLTGWTGLAFALFAAAAVPAALWQWGEVENTGFSTSSAVAGLAMAGAYVTGLCLLMRTPLAGVLHRLLSPLGRMALTNYTTATLVVLAAGWALDFSAQDRWGALFALAASVLAAQWVLSVLWLRAFRYGPLEWAWRCVTWWQVVPLRRGTRQTAPVAA